MLILPTAIDVNDGPDSSNGAFEASQKVIGIPKFVWDKNTEIELEVPSGEVDKLYI